MSRPQPDHPMLRGAWKPWPMEGEVRDLPVTGEIPRDLHGTLYRNGPNPQFAPKGNDYHFFLGDGMIHAFKLENGKCDYRNRWVRTPRFEAERTAGEALWDSGFSMSGDERTKGIPGGPANTNVIYHAGKVLALVEGGLAPVELDPVTLETKRVTNFDGKLSKQIDPALAKMMGSPTTVDRPFTAHPKIDPETGELLAFGYDALPPYVSYYVVDAQGKLDRIVEIDAPFPSMVHDFITTREHVIFPIFPATLRPERIAKGESVLGWEPDLGTHIGVMPRDGKADDVVWFQTDPCYVFHPMNARTEGRRVICEMAQYPVCPVTGSGSETADGGLEPAKLTRWTLDLDGGTVKQEQLDDRTIEFPRLDERFAGLDYRYGYAGGEGTAKGSDLIGTNAVLRYDVRTGECASHDLGQDSTGEPIFVPKSATAAEGEGYLLSVVYRKEEDRSDLLILDAQNVDREPVATVHMPHRVPAGFHGNWGEGV